MALILPYLRPLTSALGPMFFLSIRSARLPAIGGEALPIVRKCLRIALSLCEKCC